MYCGSAEGGSVWMASVAPGSVVSGNAGWMPVEADVICVEGTRSDLVRVFILLLIVFSKRYGGHF